MPDRDRLRLKLCPICGKSADSKLNPFCSARCADVDLNRWFAGAYAIPAREDDDEESNEVPAPDERTGKV
jgi:endogenous inhibitor of DNA gyrase (YacG/DUF329 family)